MPTPRKTARTRPRTICEDTVTYNMLLPRRLYDQLSLRAHDHRTSIAAIVRELVERHVANTAEDLLGR